MDGLIYLLDQAGQALAQAQQRIAALTAENTALRAEAESKAEPTSA